MGNSPWLSKEEWFSHSEDWRQGWHDVQSANDCLMTKEELASKSDEWKAGARYAIQHPVWPVAVPM